MISPRDRALGVFRIAQRAQSIARFTSPDPESPLLFSHVRPTPGVSSRRTSCSGTWRPPSPCSSSSPAPPPPPAPRHRPVQRRVSARLNPNPIPRPVFKITDAFHRRRLELRALPPQVIHIASRPDGRWLTRCRSNPGFSPALGRFLIALRHLTGRRQCGPVMITILKSICWPDGPPHS